MVLASEEIQLFLLTDDIIIHTENLKKTMQINPGIISNYSKIGEQKIQYTIVFLCIRNK